MMTTTKTINRLIDEKSPYLLQHAHNPVDWYPWGEEAFDRARAENKPVFLSIGYSTCHWCHVMEAESFEDKAVAALMNDAFVAIKVDREERPDLDNIYMDVAMRMNGSGGWPLNVLLTPDQKPFFAATYIPKENRFGMMGLIALTERVRDLWRDTPDNLLQIADKITAAVRLANAPEEGETPESGSALDADALQLAYDRLYVRFDPERGGFGDAPKFPTPHHFTFLLRYWARTGDPEALDMVETTLRAMRRGGIYDHVGFGFHRYATDAEWLVPHFEKMLYDQAMLAIAYTETYVATGKPEYAQTAREILDYVLRDMRAPGGGFYSAQDADSEGVEGKFYLWSEAELRQALSRSDADFVMSTYNATPEGNFSEEAGGQCLGTNILHLSPPFGQDKEPWSVSPRWEPIRQALFAAREKRIHPHKDDKILTDWNGLMIVALAKAAQALDEPDYANAARDASEFVLSTLTDENGRLLHRYRDGEAAIQGTVEDYAFLTWGLIELYQATFETRYLELALHLQDQLVTHFWDDAEGGFFMTPDDGETLLTRPKVIYDGAIPSGNSVAMLNLLQLARMTGRMDYENRAELLSKAFAGDVLRVPAGYTQLMVALDLAVGPSFEVVIVGQPGAEDTEAMLAALRGVGEQRGAREQRGVKEQRGAGEQRRTYVPNKVVLLRPPGDGAPIAHLAEFTQPYGQLDGKATAYVCRDRQCQLPATDVETMMALLET